MLLPVNSEVKWFLLLSSYHPTFLLVLYCSSAHSLHQFNVTPYSAFIGLALYLMLHTNVYKFLLFITPTSLRVKITREFKWFYTCSNNCNRCFFLLWHVNGQLDKFWIFDIPDDIPIYRDMNQPLACNLHIPHYYVTLYGCSKPHSRLQTSNLGNRG